MKKNNKTNLELEYALAMKAHPYILTDEAAEKLVREVIARLYDNNSNKKLNKDELIKKEAQVSQISRSLGKNIVPAARTLFNTGVKAENIVESVAGKGNKEIPTEPWAKAKFEATNEDDLYNWFQRGVAKSKDVKNKATNVVEKEVANSAAEKGAASAAGEIAEEGAEAAAKGTAEVAGEIAEEGAEAAAKGTAKNIAQETAEAAAQSWIGKTFPKFIKFIPKLGALISAATAVFNGYHAVTLLDDIRKVTDELQLAIKTTNPADKAELGSVSSSGELKALAEKYKNSPEVLGKVGKLCLHYEYLSRYVIGFIGDSLNTMDDLIGIVALLPSLGQTIWINVLTSVAITTITEIAKAAAAGKYSDVRMGVIAAIDKKIGRSSTASKKSVHLSKVANQKHPYANRPIIKNSR